MSKKKKSLLCIETEYIWILKKYFKEHEPKASYRIEIKKALSILSIDNKYIGIAKAFLFGIRSGKGIEIGNIIAKEQKGLDDIIINQKDLKF